jgi:SAM-dependent methyltransferase
METSTTRRRLRSKGTMRRRLSLASASVKINSDAISAILAPIYSELPKTTAAGQHNLTYGEIEWPALKIMLDYLQRQGTSPSQGVASPSQGVASPSGRFYDLGCGRGRAVLYMAMSGIFEHSVGIEVLPERVSLAKEALNKLRSSIPIAGAKIKLFEASFLNPAFKYKDAKLVFLSNMCFDNETQNAIFRKLNTEMPKGSLVFCSRPPSETLSAFEVLGIEKIPMTWTPTSEIHILRHL